MHFNFDRHCPNGHSSGDKNGCPTARILETLGQGDFSCLNVRQQVVEFLLESDVRNTGDGQARPPHICTDVLGAGEAEA